MRRFMGGLRYLPMIMQAYADAQTKHLLRLRDTIPPPSEDNVDDGNSAWVVSAPIKGTVATPRAKRPRGKRNLHPVLLEKRHAADAIGKGSLSPAPDMAWRQVLQELRTTRRRLRDLEQIKRELQSIQSRLPDLARSTENVEAAPSKTSKE